MDDLMQGADRLEQRCPVSSASEFETSRPCARRIEGAMLDSLRA
jgi:hypothetical protein